MTTGYRNEIWHTYLETQNSSLVLEQWKIDAGILDLYVQTKDMENCKNEKVWGFFGGRGGGSCLVCLFPPPLNPSSPPAPHSLWRTTEIYRKAFVE